MRLSINHFIASSVLAHAAILAVWASTQTHSIMVPESPSSAPAFDITLQDAFKSTTQSRPKSHQPEHTKPKPEPQQHLISAQQVEPEITPAAVVPAQHPGAKAQLAEIRRREIRDRVLSRIRTHLDQYFVYPLLAQREGWQGRVLLGFSVEANGMIRNIHVAAGSGYPLLDTSAVAALSRVQHLYDAGSWLQGERLELQMPVIFRLQGG